MTSDNKYTKVISFYVINNIYIDTASAMSTRGPVNNGDTSWAQWANYILKEIETTSAAVKVLEMDIKENNLELNRLHTSLIKLSSSGQIELLAKDIENLRLHLNSLSEDKRNKDEKTEIQLQKTRKEIEFGFEKECHNILLDQKRNENKIEALEKQIAKLNDFKSKGTAIWGFTTFLITVAIGVITAIRT